MSCWNPVWTCLTFVLVVCNACFLGEGTFAQQSDADQDFPKLSPFPALPSISTGDASPPLSEGGGSPADLEQERIGDLRLGMTPEAVRALAPGLAVNLSAEGFWEATGEFHQTWTYPNHGIELVFTSTEAGAGKVLHSIRIEAPCSLKTRRGIGVGSAEKEVAAAYPSEHNESLSAAGETFVAGDPSMALFFALEAGRVVSIFMGPGAE